MRGDPSRGAWAWAEAAGWADPAIPADERSRAQPLGNRASAAAPLGKSKDMEQTSASLLERLRRPDEQAAWARFVELYTPLLFSWARRRGLQHQDADDLIQEVLVVLAQRLPEFVY